MLKKEVEEIFKKIYNIVQLTNCNAIFNTRSISNNNSNSNNPINNNKNFNTTSLKNKQIRTNFKTISKLIKECGKLDKTTKFVFYEGLADMLFLYGCTKTYFKNNKDYGSADSDMIHIRQRDINTNSSSKDLDSSVCQGQKSYDRLYIWGQLVGWFKQTVSKTII